MSRRLEIEITSLNGNVATWRAAGAKLPKGVVDAALVPGGPVVGTVYRAEVDQSMEGMQVLSVLPAKTASPLDPRNEKLDILVSDKPVADVTVTYASKGKGPRRDRDDHGDRDGAREKRPPRAPGSKPQERKPRTERGATGEGRPARPERSERSGRPERSPRTGRPERGTPQAPPVTTVHRNAFLATLSPEQLPVAEELLRAGLPGVRSAIETQNKNAVAQGRPTIDATTIERIAEDLLGKANLAAWKDRAAGALQAGRDLKLRDLRAVVTSAKTLTLDDEGRTQLKELQTALTAKLEVLRNRWTENLDSAMKKGNLAEALRLVARPPDMSTRVTSEVAQALVSAVSAALHADQEVAVWNELVALTVETSIRRNVKPLGIPADDSAKALATKNAGAIPALAKLLGMAVPPPPPPSSRPSRPARRPAAKR